MQEQQLRLSDSLTDYPESLNLALAEEEGLLINLSPFTAKFGKGAILNVNKQYHGNSLNLGTTGVIVLFVTAGGMTIASFSFISLIYSMQSNFPLLKALFISLMLSRF